MGIVLIISSLILGAEQAPSAQLSVVLEWRSGTTSVVTLPEMLAMCDSLLDKPESLDPSTRADVLIRRARARYSLDDDLGAEHDLTQAESLRPGDIEIGSQLADIWLQKPGTREKALRWAEATIKKDPASYYGNLSLGTYFAISGNFRKAVDFHTRALETRPLSSEAILQRSIALLMLKQNEASLRDARAALSAPAESHNTAHKAHLLYGMALVRQENFSQAEPFFSQSIQLGSKKVDPLSGLWFCCSKQWKFGSCLEVAKRLSVAHPGDGQGQWMLAASRAQFGQGDRALADLAKGHPPLNSDMMESVRGRILVSKGDYREGLRYYQRVVDRKPLLVENTLRAAFLWATCVQAKIRDGELAKLHARRSVKGLDGWADQWIAYVVLATAQAECKEFEDAKQSLADARKSAPENEHCLRACRELEKLFDAGKPYRFDPLTPGKPAFEIPIAYYIGGIGINEK